MNRLSTLIIVLVAIVTGARAEVVYYGFSIGDNNETVSSLNLEQLSEGQCWTYNPAENVLYLNEGTISCNKSNALTIDGNSNPTLNICVTGNCQLDGRFETGIWIAGGGTHTIYGTGSLTLYSRVVDPTGIYAGSDRPTLTIRDITLNIWQYGGMGIRSTYFAALTLDWCELNIETRSGYAWYGALTGAPKPTMKNCYMDDGYLSDLGMYTLDPIDNSVVFLADGHVKRCVKYVDVTIEEPKVGNAVVTTATVNEGDCYVSSVDWFYETETSSNLESYYGSTYVKGNEYTAQIRLRINNPALFAEKEDLHITVNGEERPVFQTDRYYVDVFTPLYSCGSYNLWVGGVRVTDDNKDNIPAGSGGKASYNPDTKTLTLTDFFYNGNETGISNGSEVKNAIDGLTIDVQGTYGVVSSSTTALSINGGTTTITGTSELQLRSQSTATGNIEPCIRMHNNPTLNIYHANVAIQGNRYVVYGKGLVHANCSDLEIRNMGYDTGTPVGWANEYTFFNTSFSMDECEYVSTNGRDPSKFGFDLSKGGFTYDGKSWTGIVEIAAIISERYNLWVGGVRVDNYNRTSIPGLSEGKATYDPETKTLKFYGARLFADDGIYNGMNDMNFPAIDGLTIVFDGPSGGYFFTTKNQTLMINGGTTTITGKKQYNFESTEKEGVFLEPGTKLILKDANLNINSDTDVALASEDVGKDVEVVVGHSTLGLYAAEGKQPAYGMKKFDLRNCEIISLYGEDQGSIVFDTAKRYFVYNGAPYKKTLYIVPTAISTGLEPATVVYDATQPHPAYNLSGQRVGESYRGIVIKNGKKYLKR